MPHPADELRLDGRRALGLAGIAEVKLHRDDPARRGVPLDAVGDDRADALQVALGEPVEALLETADLVGAERGGLGARALGPLRPRPRLRRRRTGLRAL